MLDNQILMNQKYKKEQKRRDNNNRKTLAREIELQSNRKT
jgi:cation transport regulator ChaB